jgi:hypothetical protein
MVLLLATTNLSWLLRAGRSSALGLASVRAYWRSSYRLPASKSFPDTARRPLRLADERTIRAADVLRRRVSPQLASFSLRAQMIVIDRPCRHPSAAIDRARYSNIPACRAYQRDTLRTRSTNFTSSVRLAPIASGLASTSSTGRPRRLAQNVV